MKDDRSPNLPVQSYMLDPVAAYRLAGTVDVPTRGEVVTAVGMLPRPPRATSSSFGGYFTKQSPRAYLAPRWFVDVASGVLRVRKQHQAEKVHYGHTDDMTTVEATRGTVRSWSTKSRNRMTLTLEMLDYGPMFEGLRPPALVTLTLPGAWEQYCPTPRRFKNMVNALKASYRRSWGEPLRAVWKAEFQERGAPHLHFLMVPPAGTRRSLLTALDGGGHGELTEPMAFAEWLRYRWSAIVGSPSITDVDFDDVRRYADPRRIGAYFSKHGRFSEKEYQNEMPQVWRDGIAAGDFGGMTFWGYWGLDKVVGTMELSDTQNQIGRNVDYQRSALDGPPRDAVLAMRHLRRLAESRAYVAQVEVTRLSGVDRETGEVTGRVRVRRRKVSRKKVWLAGRSTGFLAVNDGPSTARDLARILAAAHGSPDPTRRESYQLTA